MVEVIKDGAVDEAIGSIYEQREQIVEAFIAQYLLRPDEVEQVVEYTNSGTRWYIRKRCQEGESKMAKEATEAKVAIGTNCEMGVSGDVLTIRVDLSKTFGESKSGKTLVVASTLGTVSMTGLGKPNMIIGLNVNKRK